MAAETSWHRYGTKLRHCHHMYISQWKCRQLHDASSEFIDEVIRSACYACSKNDVLRPLVSLGLLVSLPIFCGHGKTISVACVCVCFVQAISFSAV